MLLSLLGVIVPLCESAALLLRNAVLLMPSNVPASTSNALINDAVTLESMALFALAVV